LYPRYLSQPFKLSTKIHKSQQPTEGAVGAPIIPHQNDTSLTAPSDANMQHHRNASSRRTPPPDIVRSSGFTTTAPQAPPALPQPSHPSASPHPEFLIVGLFALRLTKRLIEGLGHYPGRDEDVAWITDFLAPYPLEFALAKIFGPRKEDYITTYQNIISRMKRQPRYPLRFTQTNPDQSMRQQQGGRAIEREGPREMTDRKPNSQLETF
jgi:hypothetical protein